MHKRQTSSASTLGRHKTLVTTESDIVPSSGGLGLVKTPEKTVDQNETVAKYREANNLTLQQVVGYLQEILTTSLIAYIAGASSRSVRNWASGSVQSARLDSVMKLRAALTATLILEQAEEPETIANWFINVNSYLDDASPATAIRDGKLREAMKAAHVYAEYA